MHLGATAPRKWTGHYRERILAAVLAAHYDQDLGFTPCYWCGGQARSADHYPLGRDEGGPDTLDNLVPACIPCNSRRGAQYVNAKRYSAAPGPSREW